MDYEIMMNNNLKIGMEAPDFDAVSTMGDISLSNYKGKWIVFFSHPGDFTPVCILFKLCSKDLPTIFLYILYFL